MVQRLTISLDDDMAAAIDAFMVGRGYTNRSEAIRDLVRDGLVRTAPGALATGPCVAAVSYVYNHHERDLVRRLAGAQHAHHDISVATLHAHLDHEHCMEVTLLRGDSVEVRQIAEAAIAERGVHFGHINLVPLQTETRPHSHSPRSAKHVHARPRL
jgi:CopG family transcriptional regulator, nickel-responsive regulator